MVTTNPGRLFLSSASNPPAGSLHTVRDHFSSAYIGNDNNQAWIGPSSVTSEAFLPRRSRIILERQDKTKSVNPNDYMISTSMAPDSCVKLSPLTLDQDGCSAAIGPPELATRTGPPMTRAPLFNDIPSYHRSGVSSPGRCPGIPRVNAGDVGPKMAVVASSNPELLKGVYRDSDRV